MLAQVMRAIALNRRPGFHFAGNLLDLSAEKLESGVRLTLAPQPHYIDENGEIDLTCFGMYADLAIGMGIRAVLSYSGRMATASINLGLTGAPRLAPLITAIGVSIILQTMGMLIWSRNPLTFPQLVDLTGGTVISVV